MIRPAAEEPFDAPSSEYMLYAGTPEDNARSSDDSRAVPIYTGQG